MLSLGGGPYLCCTHLKSALCSKGCVYAVLLQCWLINCHRVRNAELMYKNEKDVVSIFMQTTFMFNLVLVLAVPHYKYCKMMSDLVCMLVLKLVHFKSLWSEIVFQKVEFFFSDTCCIWHNSQWFTHHSIPFCGIVIIDLKNVKKILMLVFVI